MARAVVVEGQPIPVWELPASGGAGAARTLVFLHGLFRRPEDYAPFLEALARRLGGSRVVAPFVFGNNGLVRPPESLEACQRIADAALEALGVRKDPGGYDLVGHSTGGTMALALAAREPRARAVVAINPILPILPERRDVPGFGLRGLCIAAKQLLGLAGSLGAGWNLAVRTGGPLARNVFSNLPASQAIIRDIAKFEWSQLARAPATPVRFLLGAGDEFFTPAPDLESTLRAGPFPAARVRKLGDENSHEWLLLHPECAAEFATAELGTG